jgi:hypothetical protein
MYGVLSLIKYTYNINVYLINDITTNVSSVFTEIIFDEASFYAIMLFLLDTFL